MKTTEKTETPKHILIAENSEELKSKKRLIEDLLKVGNELSNLYNGLKIGIFNEKVLNEAINGNFETAKQLYFKVALEESERTYSLSLRDEIINTANEFRNPFSQRINDIQRWITLKDKSLIKYLTVAGNGEVVFSKDSEKALEDDTNVFIENPKEIEKYLKHQEITKLLNEFFDNGDCLPFGWWLMFPLWNGKFIMPERGANYSEMVQMTENKRKAV